MAYASSSVEMHLNDEPEVNACRICMEACEEKSPCLCSAFVHATCLSMWAREKQSLSCEICKGAYDEPIRSLLSNEIRQDQERARFHMHQVIRAVGTDEPNTRPRAVEIDAPVTQRARYLHCVLWLLGFSCLLGVVLYLAVFSDLGGWKTDTAADWISISWKVLALSIPAYILLRLCWTYYTRWRDERIANAGLGTSGQRARIATPTQSPGPSYQSRQDGRSAIPGFTPFGSIAINMPQRS